MIFQQTIFTPDSNILHLSGYADNHSLIHGFTPGEDTLIIAK